MKLVDILARELKEWPEGAHSIDQSVVDKEVYAYDEDEMLSQTKIFLSVTAEDRHTMITRAQWQAAVDALKAGEQAWNGEGLPPVGTVCEYKPSQLAGEWKEVEVIAHFMNKIMVAAFIPTGDGLKTVAQAIAQCFRPIRTAEQIAEQERAEQIELLAIDYADSQSKIHVTRYDKERAEYLYGKGWRKQDVKP